MIPSTLPQAAWWPLVGSALAHMVGDREDMHECRRAAAQALVERGLTDEEAGHLLTLHTWESWETAKTLAVEWAALVRDIDTRHGLTQEPPMPNTVCADPIGHSGQSARDEFGRPTLVQDRRRCHYCAGWINPGDCHA